MTTEMTGYIASALVLLTFMAKDARLMRTIAILSNLAFMSYAVLAGASPILCLHVLLLGVNIVRLKELLRELRRSRATQARAVRRRSLAAPAPAAGAIDHGGDSSPTNGATATS